MAIATLELDVLRGRSDLTVSDLDGLPEDLRYELIDGRLVLSPYALPIHQLIGMRIATAIEEHCPDDFIVNHEQALQIDARNELRPDVMLIRAAGAGQVWIYPLDVPLVVEVLSKSSMAFDQDGKLKKYAYAGIEHYWIVDPLGERVAFTQLRLESDGVYRRLLQTTDLVTVDQPWQVTLDLPAWTARRDRIKRAARDAN